MSRRNSCVVTTNSYCLTLDSTETTNVYRDTNEENTTASEFLHVPPVRKISDCSTNSSLSGDDFEVTELQPLKRPQVNKFLHIYLLISN